MASTLELYSSAQQGTSGAAGCDLVRPGAAGCDLVRPGAVRRARIGLLGFGTVGRAVAAAIAEHPHLHLDCVGAFVRDAGRARTGVAVPLFLDPGSVIDAADVVVEALGGVDPARTLVTRALERGIPVVTANKSLMAAHGPELRALAHRTGTPLFFEAAVIAGVPFVGALARRPLLASATSITGILNGTSHFITTAIERGASFGEALALAKARGYAEPDSRADTSGRDAAEKLAILLQLCGAGPAAVEDLCIRGIETLTPDDFAAARRLGGSIKPVALATLGAGREGSWVGPAFVAAGHALASFSGITNALELGYAIGEPILFAGPGAGPHITATTILDDVSEAVCGTGCDVPGAGAPCGVRGPAPSALFVTPPVSRWFLRIDTDELADAHLAEFLAQRGLAAVRLERSARDVAVLTVPASWAAVQAAVRGLESLGAAVTCLPVICAAQADRR